MKTSLRPPFILLGLLTFCLSALLGMGFAKAIDSPYGMVDPIDASYEAGYATYVQKCSTCHVALPAAVLPLDTWQALITAPALHPDVALPQPLNLRSCVSCHQGATEQNYSPVSTQN